MILTTPNVVFKTRVRDEGIVGGENPFRWQDVNSNDLFKGKKVVLFAIPGAFTPTCSSAHLPGYEKHYQDFKNKGINEVYCLSVNDAFVMYQWGKSLNIKNVKLIPDGNGDFTRLMGMLVNKHNLGFGFRTWRYSMYVEDCAVQKMFIETGKEDNHGSDPFECTDAETMLEFLNNR